MSVEVRASVIVGLYPMRIARFVLDQAASTNGVEARPGPSSPEDEAVVG